MRLSPATEARLPADVARPGYRPELHGVGQVHLGIGAFHRAHQAVYADTALAAAGGDWRILGVSLRSAGVRDQLAPQQGRYCLLQQGPDGESLRLVGAVAGVLVAPEDPAAVLAALADPSVRVVSLTVTEKGYCHDPATGRLDPRHPGILADLARPQAPVTAPGFLVEALARRRAAGHPAPALLACDNLAANGRVLRGVLEALAEARGQPDLARHIAGEMAIPSTMVDRIVPATTPADIERVARRTGVRDEGLVVAEPFSQWVIEAFDGPRPDWEAGGALLVGDVRPFELAKLRLLNGSHSTVAYLGCLAGWAHVHEAVAQPGMPQLLRQLMDEVQSTLAPVPGLDLAQYRRQLLDRFSNPALRHRTSQIAMDGSQKLPQRLLAPLRELVAQGRPAPALLLGVAAWLAFLVATVRRGERPDDPLAERIVERAGWAEPVPALLSLREVFGDLTGHPGLAATLEAAVADLLGAGVPAALARWRQAQAEAS